MGEPPDRVQAVVANRVAVALVKKVIAYQSRFWSCLFPKDYHKGMPQHYVLAIHTSNSNLETRRIQGAERMHGIFSI